MDNIRTEVRDKQCNIYDKFCLNNCDLQRHPEVSICQEIVLNNTAKCAKYVIHTDGAFLHYLVRELELSKTFRTSFIKQLTELGENGIGLVFILKPCRRDLIDYAWNERIFHLVRERCELHNAMSWLSTLGGAFSAYGDYYPNYAESAGKLSMYQLKLAIRLGDPKITSRCKLYLSISLIQRKQFDLAKQIIWNEYTSANGSSIEDKRLVKMCKGIWAKLKYESEVYNRSICDNKKL